MQKTYAKVRRENLCNTLKSCEKYQSSAYYIWKPGSRFRAIFVAVMINKLYYMQQGGNNLGLPYVCDACFIM